MQDLTSLLASAPEDFIRLYFVWCWQSFLLLGTVWLIVKFDRSQAPAVRYQIWLYGLFAVALLPILTMIVRWIPEAAPATGTLVSIVELPQLPTPPVQAALQSSSAAAATGPSIPWTWFLLITVWAAGMLLTAARLIKSYWKLHLIRRNAQLTSLSELDCKDARLVLALPDKVSIGLSSEVRSPALTGVLKPMILLPADIMSWTTPEERASMLIHELTHFRRRDHYMNLFQTLIGSVLFFHPIVRYACKQLSLERELACDAHVISSGAAASAYAESLLKVAERNILIDPIHQPAFSASRKILERRVDMILRRNRLPVLSKRWAFLLLPATLIAAMVWLLMPGRQIAANSIQNGNGPAPVQETQNNGAQTSPAMLPAEFSGRNHIVVQNGSNAEMEVVSFEDERPEMEKSVTRYFGNVVIKTPDFTFTTDAATRGDNWIMMIDPQVEKAGRTYYSFTSILVRRNADGAIEYNYSADSPLYVKKQPFGEGVELKNLINEGVITWQNQ
jgi:beta-lactamase regulating signal transducer with metallopeptidase domain